MTALAEALARTHAACFPAPQVWSAAMIADQIAAGGIVVGDADSFLIGRVTLDEAEILTVATAPTARRSGLAFAALADFEDLARQKGALTAFLEVAADNSPACALYARAGYAEAGRRRRYYLNADGSRSDALVMAKALVPSLP